jgi:hypothetical protein
MVQALRLALGVLLLFFLLAAHAQQVPTCTLSAEPATILGQGQVTVTWSSTGATTCVASGGWSGPKECSGTQTLTVSQSRTFILTARAAQGKVTARWTKPTQNTDGTPATVTGYKLYIADAPSGLPSAAAIALPATPLEYVFWRTPGDVSAGIKAIRSDGVDSALSNVSSKNVVAASGKCEDSVTVNPRPKAPTLTLTWLKELLSGKRRGDADET